MVRYAERYAEPITLRPTAGTTARQAVEQLIGPVTWNLVDWPIPGKRLASEQAVPLELAKRIIAAAGGVLESAPDGSVNVRRLYPVSVPDYATTTPDHVLTGDEHIYSVSETAEAGLVYDRIYIADTRVDPTYDTEWLPDEDDPLRGELRVYPWPWDASLSVDSSRFGLQLTALGPQTATLTETIEVTAGTGRTARPVDTLTRAEWLDEDLGTPTIDGVTIETAGEGWSLLQVDYSTRYLAWRVAPSDSQPAQLRVSA